MSPEDLENQLDDRIHQLRHGQPLSGALANWPEDDELRPLLELALELQLAMRRRPAPAFRAAARERLIRIVAARRRPRWRTARFWLPRVAAALLAIAFVVTGTVSAADASLPDSPVYPLKLAVEEVQLLVTRDAVAGEQLRLTIAERRLADLTALRETGDYLDSLGPATERAITATEALSPEGQAELWPRLATVLEEQQTALEQALLREQRAPDRATSYALEVSQRGLKRAGDAMSALKLHAGPKNGSHTRPDLVRQEPSAGENSAFGAPDQAVPRDQDGQGSTQAGSQGDDGDGLVTSARDQGDPSAEGTPTVGGDGPTAEQRDRDQSRTPSARGGRPAAASKQQATGNGHGGAKLSSPPAQSQTNSDERTRAAGNKSQSGAAKDAEQTGRFSLKWPWDVERDRGNGNGSAGR